MRRRALLIGGAASAALAATGGLAQQPRSYRVGILTPLSGMAASQHLSALREQLAKQGFVEGRNLGFEIRHPQFGPQYAKEAAGELAALKVDAILAFGTTMASAALGAARSTPIVFTWVADPVGAGLVKDLSRSGGNVTGVTNRGFEIAAKRLELLRETLPKAKRVAAVAGYFDSVLETAMHFAQRAADGLGFDLVRITAGAAWERVVDASIEARADALLVLTPFEFFGMRSTAEHVVRSTIERRVPAVFSERETVEIGGLMSYATSLVDDTRRGADLLARVLKGEKPGNLPVDQASRFEFAVNLKTARAIGLAIPQSLLLRADRIIE